MGPSNSTAQPSQQATTVAPAGFEPTPKAIQDFQIETADGSTAVDLRSWKLRVSGLVSTPVSLDINQVLALPGVVQTSDFRCVEGWQVRGVKWEGIRIQTLLEPAGAKPEAKYVIFHTVQGVYADALSLEQARRPDVLLAYRANGSPLAEVQGFPLRLVVAPMYGYKSVKWVNGLELTDKPFKGYWEVRTYPVDAWRG
ncbi:MAG: molybdopterin-dependent oxidoreductase [Chloroflexi bacterium]|nr:molybdopterin-dependent oxidoreductase [Chloroflexota bacterium]